jgi:hypothetical protein
MIPERKIKTFQAKNELVLWMVMGPILLVFLFLFGFGVLLFVPVLIVYCILTLLLFLRTLNMGYLLKSMLFFSLMIFALSIFFTGASVLTWTVGVFSVFLLISLIAVIVIREHRWRTTAVLEMAAMPVEEIREGYSMRPMPAGMLSYTWEELILFAGFVRKNLISVTHYELDKVVFTLDHSMGKLLSFGSADVRDTWVAFDRKGNISVHISKKDYDKFDKKYAFDELCSSLGEVYKSFFELFKEGKSQEIIRKLDILRL